MTKSIPTFGLLMIVSIGVCAGQSSRAETPKKALQAIIRLYEKQDFDTLIRKRYAEIGKAKNDQQVQTLIDRFKKRYADEKRRTQAIQFYRSLLSKTPEILGDGNVATYRMDRGFVKLSRMPNGKWGFHL